MYFKYKTNSSYLFILLLLIVSCKRTWDKAQKETLNKKDTITYDYSHIETISYFEENDSINSEFNEELIYTLPVKKLDTVLFRKWIVDSYKTLLFNNQKSKLKIQQSRFLNCYKTGGNMFSINSMVLKKEPSNKEILSFYGYCDFSFKNKNPYDLYTHRSSPLIRKKSNSKGLFDFSRINRGEFYMDFEIKNNEIHITKITEEISYFTNKAYELDTLIVINKNNKYIDVCRLYDITQKEKNLKK